MYFTSASTFFQSGSDIMNVVNYVSKNIMFTSSLLFMHYLIYC